MVPVTYRYLTCNEIRNLLDNASYCLLGVSNNDPNNPSEDNQPYVVPMLYCYTQSNGTYTFILYSYDEGQKWDYFLSNQKICLEFNWRNSDGVKSVIAQGTASYERVQSCVNNNRQLMKITLTTNDVTGRKYYNLNALS